MPGDVLRFDLTREDFDPSIAGYPAKPDLLAEGYAAFRPAGTGKAFMVVELGLKQSEVNPAMTVVIRNPLTKDTALHNHWLFENPRMMFLHFTGYGDVPGLEDAQIKSIIVPDDAVNAHGVLSLTIDRNGVKYNGMSLPPAMGSESDAQSFPARESSLVSSSMHGVWVTTSRSRKLFALH